MSTSGRAPQDPSLRARKQQLFEVDEPRGSDEVRRPFADYLRETPARPLSGGVKAGLGAVGVLVLVLLVLALMRMGETRRPAAEATTGQLEPTAATARTVG